MMSRFRFWTVLFVLCNAGLMFVFDVSFIEERLLAYNEGVEGRGRNISYTYVLKLYNNSR